MLSFATQANTYQLFILVGQSNAQGYQGDGAFYPAVIRYLNMIDGTQQASMLSGRLETVQELISKGELR